MPHVVVDAAPAGTLEQRERPVVGVEHHLLRLPRIGPNEQHPAVAEPNVSRFHDHRDLAQQDSLLNSHLADFHEDWIYVLGVGVAGGLLLRGSTTRTQ